MAKITTFAGVSHSDGYAPDVSGIVAPEAKALIEGLAEPEVRDDVNDDISPQAEPEPEPVPAAPEAVPAADEGLSLA